MSFKDYADYDGLGLADLVHRRQVTPLELVDAAIERIERHNPAINAVVHKAYDEARAAAQGPLPDGPFTGVPFLVKDLLIQVAGWPRTSGSRFCRDVVDAEDSGLMRRYRESGANTIGKTNLSEFGIAGTTEGQLFGPCRNPWNLDHIVGGSSGGAAAAVAAGIVPAAHASDGGGSIRIPASCCGLFGLKPSRGRVSFAPQGEGWAGASANHAITRSVRDSAALLDVACRPQPGDPYFLSVPERPFVEEVAREPGALRIGFTTAAMQAPAIDPECAEAVRDAARLCESLGHRVEEVTIPGDVAAMAAAAGQVIAASVAATLDAEAERRGRPIEEGEIEAMTMATYRRGQGVPGATYVRGVQALHAYTRAEAQLFESYDVLLLSTLGRTAIPVGWIFEDRKQLAERLFSYMPNTQAFNNTGQPAMTVPLAWSRDGLPIGLQFVARMGDEATLFRLAGQLEQARPWFDRIAPL